MIQVFPFGGTARGSICMKARGQAEVAELVWGVWLLPWMRSAVAVLVRKKLR